MKRIALATVVAAVVAILNRTPQPASAFTTFLGPNNTPYRWKFSPFDNQTVHWSIDPAAPAIARDAFIDAAQKWSDAVGGQVKFAEGPGGISVKWDRDGSLIPDSFFLAYTIFSGEPGGSILTAQIVVNANTYDWHRGGYTGVEAAGLDGRRSACIDSVLLHELGHAIGLDHSDNNLAAIVGAYSAVDLPTMNSQIFPGADTLHTDDITGAVSLYGTGQNTRSIQPLVVSASKTRGRRGLQVKFTQSGGDESTQWDFGDGTGAIGLQTKHRFRDWGIFPVKVQCNGSAGIVVITIEKKRK